MRLKEELQTIKTFTDPIQNTIIKDRVYDTLKWNIRKSTYYKRLFYILSITSLILNASIPIINQMENQNIKVTIISSIIFTITSIMTLINFKDVWYRYRLAAEMIKSECMFFNGKLGIYQGEDREKVFICKLEDIITDERSHWIKSRFNLEQDKIEEQNDKIEEQNDK